MPNIKYQEEIDVHLRRMSDFDENKDLPSKYDPGTKVHELVMELKKYID